jgi:hypothetical protein
MQGRCSASRFGPVAEAERRNASARCGAVTFDDYLVFSEDCEGLHRRMAS